MAPFVTCSPPWKTGWTAPRSSRSCRPGHWSGRRPTTRVIRRLAPIRNGAAAALLPSTAVDAELTCAALAIRAGDRTVARGAVEKALERAADIELVRPFARAGHGVRAFLVEQAGSFGPYDEFVGRALVATKADADDRGAAPLTVRERSVLARLPLPRSLDEVARDLGVSTNTVKTHVRAIYTKFGVTSRQPGRHGCPQPRAVVRALLRTGSRGWRAPAGRGSWMVLGTASRPAPPPGGSVENRLDRWLDDRHREERLARPAREPAGDPDLVPPSARGGYDGRGCHLRHLMSHRGSSSSSPSPGFRRCPAVAASFITRVMSARAAVPSVAWVRQGFALPDGTGLRTTRPGRWDEHGDPDRVEVPHREGAARRSEPRDAQKQELIKIHDAAIVSWPAAPRSRRPGSSTTSPAPARSAGCSGACCSA